MDNSNDEMNNSESGEKKNTTADELSAFQLVYGALEPLEKDVRNRVIKSIIVLLDIGAGVPASIGIGGNDAEKEATPTGVSSNSDIETFSTFADLHNAANPSTNSERALVAGYWLQICQGDESFGSQALNSELANLGYQITNVTSALDFLQKMLPRLVLQIRKSGSSKQARKTYKLSDAGIKRVKDMVKGIGDDYDGK